MRTDGEHDPGIILSVSNLTVAYNGNIAVSSLTFEVTRGRILGLVGPNGAGKTSVINALLGIAPKVTGSILLAGSSLRDLRSYQIVRLGIRVVTQQTQTLNAMSVLENVLMGMPEDESDRFVSAFFWKKALTKGETKRKADALALLSLVGLNGDPDAPAGGLSYGQKKRLEIARTLAGEPTVLLMDEPTAGLDTGGVGDVCQMLKAIRSSGKTILLVEHNMEAVRDVCDEIIVMDFGKMIAFGKPEEVLANPRVLEAYIGRGEHG
ncbi:MAG: Lipopolysaccharide export system ATP-binding protein LptB [Syntrophorhabdus sp. PtaU1.Bin153]|nr:MAG: Lipopolysaccharide export system ATP-binding protein LptB [Syntrophorhabdus sp. PtaU1.Bin153]